VGAPSRRDRTPYEQHRNPVLLTLAHQCPWLDSGEREAAYHDAYLTYLEKERDRSLDTSVMRPPGAGLADPDRDPQLPPGPAEGLPPARRAPRRGRPRQGRSERRRRGAGRRAPRRGAGPRARRAAARAPAGDRQAPLHLASSAKRSSACSASRPERTGGRSSGPSTSWRGDTRRSARAAGARAGEASSSPTWPGSPGPTARPPRTTATTRRQQCWAVRRR
jgi:hypothetical protein